MFNGMLRYFASQLTSKVLFTVLLVGSILNGFMAKYLELSSEFFEVSENFGSDKEPMAVLSRVISSRNAEPHRLDRQRANLNAFALEAVAITFPPSTVAIALAMQVVGAFAPRQTLCRTYTIKCVQLAVC